MTEWKYPGDEAIRRAFGATISKILEEKGLTVPEFEKRMADAGRDMDKGFHRRAFGRAVRKLREERNMSRRELAASAGIPVRLVIQTERGQGHASLTQICRMACGLKLRPHELMRHYETAMKQADSSQARGFV
jgi:predicted transcriptional regulator